MSNNKKVRVALYIRVSTVEQTEGFGLDMQKDNLLEHVKRNSYKNWETNDSLIFVEQGSGGTKKRKGLERLLKMAKDKKFDLVLVWKIDRISRSLTDLLDIFGTLHSHNIGFASLKEDIDFSGPIGKLIFQIFGALAEFERETIRMRTEEGKKVSAAAGNYIGGGVPYGYKKVPNKTSKGSKLEIIPEEAEIVSKIFHDYVYKNKSFSSLAKGLNQLGRAIGKGQPTVRMKRKWLPSKIKNILSNDIYRGQYITNRYKTISRKPLRKVERLQEEWITSSVEPVVSNGLFFEAQQKLSNKGRRGGGKKVYMLSRKIIDVETGKKFVGYMSSKNTRNYRRKRFADSNNKVWKTISIAAKDLENTVWDYVEKAINRPEFFFKIHQEQSLDSNKSKRLESEYGIYEKSVSKSNTMINRVKDDFYSGNIDEIERDERLSLYTKERDSAFKSMKDVEKQLRSLAKLQQGYEDLKQFSDNMRGKIDNLSYKQKTNIVSMLVEKVELGETPTKRTAKVFFRFDPKAITESIPRGRTDIVEKQGEKEDSGTKNKLSGGR